MMTHFFYTLTKTTLLVWVRCRVAHRRMSHPHRMVQNLRLPTQNE